MTDRLVLQPSGRIVADRVRWARSARARARGLLRVRELVRGEALVIEPAFQIHTVGMAQPIDVVFCDASWQVRHAVRAMRPNRITRVVFGARRAVELAAGTLPPEVISGAMLALIDDVGDAAQDR